VIVRTNGRTAGGERRGWGGRERPGTTLSVGRLGAALTLKPDESVYNKDAKGGNGRSKKMAAGITEKKETTESMKTATRNRSEPAENLWGWKEGARRRDGVNRCSGKRGVCTRGRAG